MTEEQARDWLYARFGATAIEQLGRFAALVIAENARQNLIAPSTITQLWARHIVDSVQLVSFATSSGTWLDIGTGGGFPGLVVAIVRPEPIVLVEPRRLRVKFLQYASEQLQIADRVCIEHRKVELLNVEADVISARAVASIENILRAASGCATTRTRWLLPRGQLENSDVSDLQRRWSGVFHVEQSLIDPASSILVADGVKAK